MTTTQQTKPAPIPQPVVEVITRTWEVITSLPPRECRCGHEHFGRTADNYAPQWHICEGDCANHSLRPVDGQ